MWAAALLVAACGDGTAERRAASEGTGDRPAAQMVGEQGDVAEDEGAAAEQPVPATTVAGGETSEFSGGDIPACPCGTLKNPLRATVMSVVEQTVRLRVDELPLGAANAEVGSEIEGGLWYGGLPCYFGRADVAVGDEVLAFYWPSTNTAVTQSRIALTQWGPTVVLADATRDLTVSIDDLPLLDASEAECRAGLGNIADYTGPADDTLP